MWTSVHQTSATSAFMVNIGTLALLVQRMLMHVLVSVRVVRKEQGGQERPPPPIPSPSRSPPLLSRPPSPSPPLPSLRSRPR